MESAEQPEKPGRQGLSSSTLVGFLIGGIVIFIARFTPGSPVGGALDNMDWLTEQAVKLAKELFESYGYLTVFFAPMAENTIFLGALIPGTLIILLAGLSAHDGLVAFPPALALGAAGAMVGDTISYGIGRFGAGRLGPESRIARWGGEMRESLGDHSVWLVLSYHFFGYSRLIGPAASGFLRLPFLRWVLLDYIGVSVWVTLYMSLGYLLGVAGLSLDESDKNVRVIEIILFAFFVIAIVSLLRTTRRRTRERQAAVVVDEGAEG